MEQTHELGNCQTGVSTETPCPYPATSKLYNRYPVCEAHAALAELEWPMFDLRQSIVYLDRWIRTADGHDIKHLSEALKATRSEFAAELERLQAEERRILAAYDLPLGTPSAPREPEYEPQDEEERRLIDLIRRGDRASNALTALEDAVESLQESLEEAVMPILENERNQAWEKAERAKVELESR